MTNARPPTRWRPRRIGRFVAILAASVAFIGWGGASAGALSTAEGLTWFVVGCIALTEGGALLLARCGITPDWVGSLEMRNGARAPVAGWAGAFVVAAGYSAWTLSIHPVIARHVLDLEPVKLVGLMAALGAGILEEVVFRRMLMDGLARRGTPGIVQVVASGLAFGALHAPWGLLAGSVAFAVGAMIATSILGLALASVYLVGRRRLGPCIASHLAIDAILEPWLLFAALGGV